MNFGSTAANIELIALAVAASAISGLFVFDISPVSILFFFLFNQIGVYMMLHRYYSHQSFEFRSQSVRIMFQTVALLAGRGSPLGWAYIHRKHHRNSDTAKDPHRASDIGLSPFSFRQIEERQKGKFETFMVRDLINKEQLFIHEWYLAIVLGFVALLGFISLEALWSCWIVPVFLVNISQSIFNYFGHTTGYRNFETNDHSTNNVWLFPVLLGEAWHNNHHKYPGYHKKVKWWEFDPINIVIRGVGHVSK